MSESRPDAPLDDDAAQTQTRGAFGVSGGTIGPYRLLETLGEGGMGEVWLAEQTRPVRRQVALKIIKLGMDTTQVVARFEAERQALALMDHPAIAKVFDAGATDLGRPYFAMEHVRGESLTAYCDRQRLTIQQRLELFVHVCEGVQHAHQKGVIHRDLKPSNILVTLQDDRPVPKIIDFGVAKATSQPLTEHTLYTSVAGFVGTPEYMSPEQAEMGGVDIDTRTDVYALGVVLYELLTGVLPFDRHTLKDKSIDEIRRTIRESDPLRPSTRITQLPAASTDVARIRRVEPSRLRSLLRGDLDWITMKALEKDRARRYGSASDLAGDVRRHLANHPVLAGPPSAAYRTRKFVQRHRFGVVGAAALLLLLTVFAIVMAVQAQRIARERDRANSEAQLSKQITDFLTGLFSVSDPGESRGKSVTARELLDAGARQIETTLHDQPVLQARLMETIGVTYDRLGLYDQAQAQLEQALLVRRQVLGQEHPETVRTHSVLAAVYARRGQYQHAATLYEQVVDIQRRTLGAEHPDRLAALQDLGWLMAQGGRHLEGEKLVRDALEIERRVLGNEHSNTLRGINRLAAVMGWQGRYSDEEKLCREELEIRRRVQGRDHPDTLSAANALASAVADQGRLDEAEPLLRETLEITQRVLGPDHPGTARAMNNLATLLVRQKHLPEAEKLFLGAIDIWRRTLGPESNNTLTAMNNLGLIYLGDHRDHDAERLFSELLASSRRVRGPEHQGTLMIMNNLALTYANERRYDEATKLARETIAVGRRVLGDKHPMTSLFIVTLSEVVAQRGDHQEALQLLREAVNHGYRDADQIANDEYLRSLRSDPRFKALVEEIRELRRTGK